MGTRPQATLAMICLYDETTDKETIYQSHRSYIRLRYNLCLTARSAPRPAPPPRWWVRGGRRSLYLTQKIEAICHGVKKQCNLEHTAGDLPQEVKYRPIGAQREGRRCFVDKHAVSENRRGAINIAIIRERILTNTYPVRSR